MIVPRFFLTQTSDTVTLEITAKYIKLNELEFFIQDERIYFYCNPYHLKLCLPGALKDEVMHSKYDSDKGILTFVMKKAIPGEHFKNLDMIIRLLTPVNEKKKIDRVLILDDADNVMWEDTYETAHKYGFAMKGLYDFHRIINEYVGIFKVDPRINDLEERKKLQSIDEKTKFNVEHYEADFAEEESLIRDIIQVDSPWSRILKISLAFVDAELDILKDLPNKNYNLSPEQRVYCYTSLIDILFAYCYDARATCFEGNCESGWTITEIAASLGWLTGFDSPKSAIISGFRRSLIYPLFRNYNLSLKVFEDLKIILNLGEVCIMKCLLQIYNIFIRGGDCCRYILNDIFIKDYIIYVGKWDSNEWNNIVKEVMDMKIEKKDLQLSLDEIETQFLQRVLQENVDSDDEIDEEAGAAALPEDIKKTFREKLNALEKNLVEECQLKLTEGLSNLSLDINNDTQNEGDYKPDIVNLEKNNHS
ncbi:hypothetical protein WA026_004777 [Henosepilachna vigintioctopunctata]|uniref:Protein SHQ1 homolog n=1 Tax=Henosepilachna vigintioctopunctata TaxID=420089 RepID=A0AAW1V7H9_9CUCU